MKKLSIFKILTVLIASTLLVVSCTKENSDVRLDPKLSTSNLLEVTSATATVIGFVVASGDGFSEKGVVYSTEAAPTVEDTKVPYTGEDNTATYAVKLTGLDYATKYYVRAYAVNATGTLYGEEFTFTTLPIPPTVTTTVVTDIKGISAVSGGVVTDNGRADVTARGVVYGKTPNPTIEGSKTSDGTGLGAFTSNITGLSGLTKYYVRAYATNSAGTAYGEQLEFTTLVSTRKWYVPGNYVDDSYPGSAFNNWSPGESPTIESTEAAPDNVEGYVYMALENNEWKIATQPNWDGPNYGLASAGQLSGDGGNITSPAGYYKINVNAEDLTYTAVATTWGVIGNASPGGWDNSTPLVYNPRARTWTGGMTMTVGDFKFRANNAWTINYGGTDPLLVFNAGNIPLSTAGDYFFTLDLSHPNAYTYTANRWGVIGDATPGLWDNDTNMTWDPVNRAMTATIALTAGNIKFRANDAWVINLGGSLDALTQGGDNIAITSPGTYVIRLFVDENRATLTPATK